MSSKIARMLSVGMAVALLALMSGFQNEARATAFYYASATADLSITGFRDSDGNSISRPGALTITGSASTSVNNYALHYGNALAVAYGTAAFVSSDPIRGVGEKISLAAYGLGWASFPPISEAQSLFETDGLVSIFNSSSNSFWVDFALDYTYNLTASVGNPLAEYAFSSIFIGVYSVNLNEMLFQNLIQFDTSNPAFGGLPYLHDEGGSGDTSLTISLLAGAGLNEYALFNNDVFSGAGAFAPVPEPATMILLGSGLLGLAGFRRRRFAKVSDERGGV